MNVPFDRRRTLVLKRGKERVVANRHPWIFAGAIHSERGPDDSAIGELVDGEGKRLAAGFYSRTSQIRLRALTFGDEELTPELIARRIADAIARRKPILDDATNAARLVHAEGDELSSIVIDRYADLIVVEIANRGAEQLKPLIVDTLQRELTPRLMYFKNDLPVRALEQLSLEDEVIACHPERSEGPGRAAHEERASQHHPSPGSLAHARDDRSAYILESGLRFRIDPGEGQKTGFFLDQRENRRLARSLAAGKRVLNLFSYSGAFGVYAAAGGAIAVTNVDVSARAIDLARENHALNDMPAEHIVADAFQYVRQHRDPFDLIVCDPPAFAKTRADIDRAARGYKDVNLHALRLVAPGGMLMTFSCSGHMSLDLFQKVIFAAAHDAARRVSFVRRLTAGPDHPVSLYAPEGEYLKGFLLEVR